MIQTGPAHPSREPGATLPSCYYKACPLQPVLGGSAPPQGVTSGYDQSAVLHLPRAWRVCPDISPCCGDWPLPHRRGEQAGIGVQQVLGSSVLLAVRLGAGSGDLGCSFILTLCSALTLYWGREYRAPESGVALYF